MGFLGAAQDTRQEFLVVVSARGKLDLDGEHYGKARVFVLEDRTVTVVTPVKPRGLEWRTYTVESSTWNPPSKLLTVTFAGDNGGLALDAGGCGCGMGAVGNAGPIDGPYKLVKVRSPEWHTVT